MKRKNKINETELEARKQLWNAFFDSKNAEDIGDVNIKNKLIEKYFYIVSIIAKKMHQRITSVSVEELESMGVDGLYDAIDKYDRTFNNKFETYAALRIRGSILDAIRKADWIPRLVRSNTKRIEKQRNRLEADSGKHLTNAEMAEKLNLSLEDFEDQLKAAYTPSIYGSENVSMNEKPIHEIKDTKTVQPIETMMKQEFFSKLMNKNFTPQERKIIYNHYYEKMSLQEIGDKMKLSECRISQIHQNICKRLKVKIEKNPEYFSDILLLLNKN
jgi:RNA polymerase sigma factor FliA